MKPKARCKLVKLGGYLLAKVSTQLWCIPLRFAAKKHWQSSYRVFPLTGFIINSEQSVEAYLHLCYVSADTASLSIDRPGSAALQDYAVEDPPVC